MSFALLSPGGVGCWRTAPITLIDSMASGASPELRVSLEQLTGKKNKQTTGRNSILP